MFDRWSPYSTASWAWWAILGPLGGIATGFWFARRSETLGVHDERRPAFYIALNVVGTIGCSLCGALLSEP